MDSEFTEAADLKLRHSHANLRTPTGVSPVKHKSRPERSEAVLELLLTAIDRY